MALISMPVRRPATIPTALKGQSNGAISRDLLTQVDSRDGLTWLMADLAARSMKALHAAAAKRGLKLTSTGRGRTLSQQWGIFGGGQARYQPATLTTYNNTPSSRRRFWPKVDYSNNGMPAPGRDTAAHLLGVEIPDTSYWVMKNFGTAASPQWPAMAAVPGTSNHGFWLADDLAKVDPTGVKPYLSFNAADLQILYELGPLYGFYWDTPSENWHVHWMNGDSLTQATLDYENPPAPVPPEPQPVPPTPEPPVSSDLVITIYKLVDANARFIALTTGKGVALFVEWSGDGSDPKVLERLNEHIAAGATESTISIVDLENTTLVGPLPKGDGAHNWTGAEFFRFQRPDGTWSR